MNIDAGTIKDEARKGGIVPLALGRVASNDQHRITWPLIKSESRGGSRGSNAEWGDEGESILTSCMDRYKSPVGGMMGEVWPDSEESGDQYQAREKGNERSNAEEGFSSYVLDK